VAEVAEVAGVAEEAWGGIKNWILNGDSRKLSTLVP